MGEATHEEPHRPYALPAPEVTRRTARLEQVRAFPYGFLQTCEVSFFLLIAVERFDATGLAKSVLAAGPFVGLMLSPWIVGLVRVRQWSAMHAATALMLAGAVASLAAAAAGTTWAYALGAAAALACPQATVPLLTTVYQANYGPHERGKQVARAAVVRLAVTAAIGPIVGGMLRRDIANWRFVLLAAAVSFTVSAVLLRLLPSGPIAPVDRAPGRSAILPDFSLLVTDRVLRTTLLSWMLVGFANLMMVPLRVEYLANDRYDIAADAGKVALLTVTVPAVVRLAVSPLFGWMFDVMSFFALRIALNVLFALGILAFFTGRSDPGLLLGAVVFGVAAGGGDLMWTLWAMKLAPPERVADYMGLHTFTTGLRGLVAPFVAFRVVESFSVAAVGAVAAVLIVLGSAVLLPDARHERSRRRTPVTTG